MAYRRCIEHCSSWPYRWWHGACRSSEANASLRRGAAADGKPHPRTSYPLHNCYGGAGGKEGEDAKSTGKQLKELSNGKLRFAAIYGSDCNCRSLATSAAMRFVFHTSRFSAPYHAPKTMTTAHAHAINTLENLLIYPPLETRSDTLSGHNRKWQQTWNALSFSFRLT